MVVLLMEEEYEEYEEVDYLSDLMQKNHKKQLHFLFHASFEILVECTKRVKNPCAVNEN